MKNILMIESWIGGTGRLLPVKIRERGYTYTFVTRKLEHYIDSTNDIIHPVIKNATHIITTETNNIDELIPFLLAQNKILHFDGVITVCDYYIDTVVKVAKALNLPMPFFDTVNEVRQKHLVRQVILNAGFPNPEFKVIRSWNEAREAALRIKYPLVIKPGDLASSAYVKLVGNEDELKKAYEAMEKFQQNFRDQPREHLCLLEAFMYGPEFSVETCTFNGETTVLGITDKSVTGEPFFIEEGHMFPADLSKKNEKQIIDLVKSILIEVGFEHGIGHTEVKLTKAGPMIVEINPRPGGNYITELVNYVTGIDLVNIFIDLAIGEKPDLTVVENSFASAAIRFLVPTRDGTVVNFDNTDILDKNSNVVRFSFSPVLGKNVKAPIDNACYLGHVVAVDRTGHNAGKYADEALSSLNFRIEPCQCGINADNKRKEKTIQYNSISDLVKYVLTGNLGINPEDQLVTGACWIQQHTRFSESVPKYNNYYLILRVGKAFGACCVEKGQVDPEIAQKIVGRKVAELLTNSELAVRIAVLDAFLGENVPHREAFNAKKITLPLGTSEQRAIARDQAIVSLLSIHPGQKVGLIGVVNPLVKAIRDQGGVCLPCDFSMEKTLWGDPVASDMTQILDECEMLISTAMTLGNNSFDLILKRVRERGIPWVVYAQTGSAIVPFFLDQGVSAISAESFPFSQFSAEPTTIYCYHSH